MSSQGQRFRRRALRRGYKVDEVDAFLDRVEAMLVGGPVEMPVAAQEVRDVVFRVRFGGYDEWQVDLHLDRVERQLAELEERAGFGARGPEPRTGPPVREERMAPAERMGPPMGGPGMGPAVGSPLGPPGGAPPYREERTPPSVPARPVSPMAAPPGPPPMPPPMPPPAPGYGRYDEPTFAGFEPVRHPKADMTAEMRLGDPARGAPPGPAPMPAPIPGAPPEVQRVDQLRRSFQPRRFGSGYDPAQVNRVFETVIASMTGRTPPVTEAQLDPAQFSLVSGGYFEAEVEAALREVREILRRR